MGAAWFISWQRPPWSYTINWCHVSRCCRPKQLMSMLSTCHSACIQQQAYALSWLQWAATVWMHVMLSLKDSRHGLSSIYSFFLHFEKSATFGTVGCSKVFYGNTQWNFSLCWFCLNLILFVLIPACGDVALCFDVCSVIFAVTWLSASTFATEGGMTPASDEIVTNPASANELCFLQIHGAVCMTEDEFCLTVNGSSRVKRCI